MTTFPNVNIQNQEEENNLEIQNEDITPQEVFVEKKTKQSRKPRKPLSEEAKQKLAIAREKSLEVRRQKKKDRENANKKVLEQSKPIDIAKKVEHKKTVEIIDEEHNELEESVEEPVEEEQQEIVYVKKPKKQKKKPKIVYVEESSEDEEPEQEKVVYRKKQKKQNKPKDLFTAQEVEIYANHKVNTYKKQLENEKEKSKKKLDEARRNLLWNMR